MAGVDWHIGIIPAKFLGPQFGLTSDAIEALDYLTALKRDTGLDIVATNNSWGGGEDGQALLDAIERAGDAGILFVAAAGNSGLNIDTYPSYPASYRCDRHANGKARGWDCIVSVANIDHNGDLNGLSNRGRTSVDLGAPGTNIVSTVPDEAYANYTGTSMATPHVTGALALCASIDPALTPRQLRSTLLSTTMATTSLASTTATGGRLDIGALATRCASGEPAAPVDRQRRRPGPRIPAFGPGWHHGWFGKQGHHYWLATRAGQSQANGTWRPKLDEPGRYRIQAWIPGQSHLSAQAVYRIRTGDGWVSRRLSQARHRRGWLSLGVFELGALPVIRLSDATGEGGSQARRLVFDKLRVVPTKARLTVTASADERPSRPGADAPSPGTTEPSLAPESSDAPPGEPAATPEVDSGPLEPSPAVEPVGPEQPETTPRPDAGPGDGGSRPDRTPERPAPRTEPPPDPDAGGSEASQAPTSEDAHATAPTAPPEAASSEG